MSVTNPSMDLLAYSRIQNISGINLFLGMLHLLRPVFPIADMAVHGLIERGANRFSNLLPLCPPKSNCSVNCRRSRQTDRIDQSDDLNGQSDDRIEPNWPVGSD